MVKPPDTRVSVSPEEIAKRQISHWDGLSAETVQFTGNDPFEYQYKSDRHLLVVCHRAMRFDGETSIEGLTPSALRSFGRTLCLVPAGRAYNGSFLPRVLPRSSYFYIDPQKIPVDPEIHSPETEIAPRLFFFDQAIWETAMKLCALIETPSASSRLYADALAAVLALEVLSLQSGTRIHLRGAQGGLAARQERIVKEYINEHLAEDISLGELSALAVLSPTHFSRAFKSSFGASPATLSAARARRTRQGTPGRP